MSLQLNKSYKLLPYLAILSGLIMSILAGWFTYKHYEEKENLRLEMASSEIVLLVKNRMAAYEQALRSGVALFKVSDNVTYDKWTTFVQEQKLDENLKGIQAFGYAEVVLSKNKQAHEERIRKEGFPEYTIKPEGQREFYVPVIYINPLNSANQKAFGYDMFSEKVRREAMLKAIKRGEAVLSGKIQLVQEHGKDIQAGFLMYFPVYTQDTTHEIQGFISAPFRSKDLMHGITGIMSPHIDFEIYDGNSTKEENTLYTSQSNHDFSTLYKTTSISIHNHTWTLVFRTCSVFESENIYIILLIPSFILVLTILFYLLLSSLIKTREYAIHMAKRTTTQLHASEEKYRSLVESTSDWVWEVNSEGIYTYVSPQVETLIGYTPQEVLGKTPFNFMPEEEAHQISTTFKALVDTEASIYAIKNTNICKDGSVKILETSANPFFNKKGELLGYRGIDRDITERLRVEQALHASEEIMLTQSKQAAMGEMISMIAHQWRQPLNVIGLAVANIQTKQALNILDEKSIDDNADIITDNITFMSDTIDDFRDYFKPDAKKELTNIQEVLNIVLKIIGKSLENNDVLLNITNNSKGSLSLHKNSFAQVIINIISNAKDALISNNITDASINLVVDETRDTIVFSVCDNAGGIPSDIIKKIHEPYFSTKSLTGTGLGLYISRIIIEKHLFGTFTWHNKDKGACFVITLNTNDDERREQP